MGDDIEADTNSRDAMMMHAAALLHDLRTPLLTIRALAVLLDDFGAQASPAREIEKQVDRLNARLDDFWQLIDTTLEETAVTEPAGKPIFEPRASFSVLYVDDDELHREIGHRLLAQSGCSVVLCANGAEALERCDTEVFDIVFFDRNTPVLSGIEAARQLSLQANGGVVPYMVGMSNDPRGEALGEECLDAGMQDYFSKPLTVEKLATVFQKINCHHQPREGR